MANTTQKPVAFQRSVPWTARQPGKTAWIIFQLLSLLLVRLPFWCLFYIPSTLRQNPTWAWKQALTLAFAKYSLGVQPSIWPKLTPEAKTAIKGVKADVFELIPPAPARLLKGVTNEKNTHTRPSPCPAAWWPLKPGNSAASMSEANATQEEEKVVIWFSGGAYVIGDYTQILRTTVPAKFSWVLNGAKTLSVGYRLASSDGNHFPCQLIDAISAYQHVLHIGVKPSNIFLAGASAGGNLVLSLLRYLSDNGSSTGLPMPGGALLDSPWVDLSQDWNSLLRMDRHQSDVLDPRLLDWGVECYLPPQVPPTGPYISAVNHAFQLSTPLWMCVDSDEIMCDPVLKFYEEMTTLPGNNIRVHLSNGGTHGTLTWGLDSGWKDQAEKSFEDLKDFLHDQHCRSSS